MLNLQRTLKKIHYFNNILRNEPPQTSVLFYYLFSDSDIHSFRYTPAEPCINAVFTMLTSSELIVDHRVSFSALMLPKLETHGDKVAFVSIISHS